MYNQAFDLYHSIFRMIHILNKYDVNEVADTDRLRIWDFYLLFPQKIHTIRLSKDMSEARKLRSTICKNCNNPYDTISDRRKLLERLRPYQIGALTYLASLGIIDGDRLLNNEVVLVNREKLNQIILTVGKLDIQESNALAWLIMTFRLFPLNGVNGLKDRTGLLISKYDGF